MERRICKKFATHGAFDNQLGVTEIEAIFFTFSFLLLAWWSRRQYQIKFSTPDSGYYDSSKRAIFTIHLKILVLFAILSLLQALVRGLIVGYLNRDNKISGKDTHFKLSATAIAISTGLTSALISNQESQFFFLKKFK